MSSSNFSPYQIGNIPELPFFEKLTSYEQHLDSIHTKYRKHILRMIESDSIFSDNMEVFKEDRRNYIKYRTIMSSLLFKENRSWYKLQRFLNGKPESIPEKDTLSTECNCFLTGGSIKIKMGIWVFGGFDIKLFGNYLLY